MGRDTKRIVAGTLLMFSGLVWNVHYGELSPGPSGAVYRSYVLVGGMVMSLGFGIVYGVWRSRGVISASADKTTARPSHRGESAV